MAIAMATNARDPETPQEAMADITRPMITPKGASLRIPATCISLTTLHSDINALRTDVTVWGACATFLLVPANDWLVAFISPMFSSLTVRDTHSSQTHPLPWNLMSGRELNSSSITTTVMPSAINSHTPLSTVRPMLFCVRVK